MLNVNQITLNSVVNFEYISPTVLGTAVRGAKVLAILDHESATAYINPMVYHASFRPHMPASAPQSFTDYPYVKLRMPDNTTMAVGLPWIQGDTWEEQSVESLRFTVSNVTPAGRQIIMRALAANGFNAVNVESVP